MFEKGQLFEIVSFDESDKKTYEETRKKVHELGDSLLSLGMQVVRGKEENKIYIFIVYKG